MFYDRLEASKGSEFSQIVEFGSWQQSTALNVLMSYHGQSRRAKSNKAFGFNYLIEPKIQIDVRARLNRFLLALPLTTEETTSSKDPT